MARAPKITMPRIAEWLREGVGQGHGEDYRPLPFLEIRRWNPSAISNQVWDWLPPFIRHGHFWCRSEWYLALLFTWVGARVREQYPLWPWRHPHPAYGMDQDIDATLPWSSGIIQICRDAGIDHGFFVGTRIPYIWSLDLLLALTWVQEPTSGTLLVSVKPQPIERHLMPDPIDRHLEKLEIERRYAVEIRSPYLIATATQFPGPLLGQLEWLKSASLMPQGGAHDAILQSFLDKYSPDLADRPPADWIDLLESDFCIERSVATYVIQHCLWKQYIDCDLSKHLDMEQPPHPGGMALRDTLRNYLASRQP